MNSVFNYVNYRRYLKDYYQQAKAEKKYFSYRYFSRRAGINSPNFLKVVIEGKRNLSSKTIDKFTGALGLNGSEALFFRRLVLFNQSKTSSEKRECYLILKEMANQISRLSAQTEFAGNFDNWYANFVRELMADDSFGQTEGTGKNRESMDTHYGCRPMTTAAPGATDRITERLPETGTMTLRPQTTENSFARTQTFIFEGSKAHTVTTNDNATVQQFVF